MTLEAHEREPGSDPLKPLTRHDDEVPVDINGFAEVVQQTREAYLEGDWGRGRSLDPLHPGAREEHIRTAAEALATVMPQDVRNLWSVSDGGFLAPGTDLYFSPFDLDKEPYVPLGASQASPFEHSTLNAREMVQAGGIPTRDIEHRPSADVLGLTKPAQYGLWYEVSGPDAGAVLYYRVTSPWGVCVGAPSLESLFGAFRDVTRLVGRFVFDDRTQDVFRSYEVDPRLLT